ncbi:hypothetical protein D3C84_1103850 [compost metagenome]
MAQQILWKFQQHIFGVTAHFKHHLNLPRHCVWDIWGHIKTADGRNDIVRVSGQRSGHIAGLYDHVRSTDQRVSAKIHGCRTGMIW